MGEDFYDRALAPPTEQEVNDAELDLKWLMSSDRGRRLMHRFLSSTGQYVTSYAGDPHLTAFNEGRRQVGLVWFAEIRRLCPENELRMYIEAQNK